MKLAFIDNLPVGGGLSRFSLLLCKSLVENNKSLTIDYYIHAGNLLHIPEIMELNARVNVLILNSTKSPTFSKRIKKRILKKINSSRSYSNETIKEIEQRIDSRYDVAYFPSAHMMQRPVLSIPMVGTLHDFNWKYFFGRSIFSLDFVKMMDVEILEWMKGYNVCSSYDVIDEAKKLYPNAKRFPTVVHIAPVVVNKEIAPERIPEILSSLQIDYPYIIFPGNFFPHKNHLNLFTAFSILKQKEAFADYKLILTGMNSEQIPYGIATYRGVQVLTSIKDNSSFDVRGMGYQTNEVIEILIKAAKILVSPSIYEAICTPAMDGWNFGTPAAISNIAPFKEHQSVWGVSPNYFDPMNPQDIASVLENCLTNYTETKANGLLSKQKMAAYTWDKVAKGYMEVFTQAITNK